MADSEDNPKQTIVGSLFSSSFFTAAHKRVDKIMLITEVSKYGKIFGLRFDDLCSWIKLSKHVMK